MAAYSDCLDAPDLKYVVCIHTGDRMDLQLLKVYQVTGVSGDLVGVIDDSGEVYLYTRFHFWPVQAPEGLMEMAAHDTYGAGRIERLWDKLESERRWRKVYVVFGVAAGILIGSLITVLSQLLVN